MWNFKKFTSGLAAMAVAATAFVAVPISAGAATKDIIKYTLPEAVTGALASANPGWTPGSTDVDFGDGVTAVTSGMIYIDYQVDTTVDLNNTGGNRPGYTTLKGFNDNGDEITVFDFYSNTQKSNNKGRFNVYAIGGRVVDDATQTRISASTTLNKLSFSLAVNLTDNKISGTIKGIDDTSVSVTIPETTLDVSALKGFNLGSTTSNKQTLSSASVYTKEEVEYFFNTVPYAKVTVDGTVYNSGTTGSVEVSNPADGQTVTVEKSGYTTVNTTVDMTNGNNVTLVPADAAVSYYEDFTNVEDGTFGFSGGATVANGSLSYSSGSGTNTTTLPVTSTADKTIHFNLTSNCASTNHTGYLYLTGTGLSLYFYGNQIRLHGYSADKSKGVNTGFAQSAKKVDVVFNTNGKASFYADGKFIGDVYYTGTELTGLSADQTKGTFAFTMDEIAVKETALANVTIADEGAQNTSVITKYISGTQFTLPAPAGEDGYTFKGWKKDDDTDLLAAGTIVTATTTTYTAVYEQNTGDITPIFVGADGTEKLGNVQAEEGKIGGSNGNTIATAFALNNTLPYGTSVNGIAWDISVPAGSYIRTDNATKTAINGEWVLSGGVGGFNIYPTKAFNLKLVHEMPTITDGEVLVGLVINNLYVNTAIDGASASASFTDSYNESNYVGYDKLTLPTKATGGVFEATDATALSETTAFGELMSIDSILTMMYDEDELAEITGDIASEDNADITGIDDEIDMTDYNDGDEAVGE